MLVWFVVWNSYAVSCIAYACSIWFQRICIQLNGAQVLLFCVGNSYSFFMFLVFISTFVLNASEYVVFCLMHMLSMLLQNFAFRSLLCLMAACVTKCSFILAHLNLRLKASFIHSEFQATTNKRGLWIMALYSYVSLNSEFTFIAFSRYVVQPDSLLRSIELNMFLVGWFFYNYYYCFLLVNLVVCTMESIDPLLHVFW